MAPNSPTSFRRLSVRTIRIALLLGLVAVTAGVLSSTSFASSLGQRVFSRVATLVSANQAAPTNQTVDAEFEEAAAAPLSSSTMTVERRGHTATRLADGRVLIAGGENGDGTLNQTEIYDPASGTFSAAGNMDASRADHTATLLADGRVLVAGGRSGGSALATTEIFDPATGSFTSGPSMSVARAGHSATLFANGRVLIAGGDSNGSTEIFDASAGTFTAGGSMGVARSMHSAALLQDGRVLIVGGRDGNGSELLSGEIFDTPAATFWTIGNALKVSRVSAHLHVLFDGKVQIVGGNNDGSMEVYDPLMEGFGAYAHVQPEGDTCAGLPGQILNSQTRAALFHNGQADPLLDRSGHTITELGGQALVLGGVNSSGAVLGSSEVLGSSSAAVTTDRMDYAPGETAHISGRGFQPGEVVRVKIHEDPHTPQERGFDVTADAEGNFSGDYLVMEYDLDMKFIVGARGLTSGATAQTTMTDANPQTITVAAPTSVTVIQGATANYGNVTVTVGGNNSPCTVTLGVTPGLPAGATPVFGNSPATTTGASIVSTFSVTTTAATVPGTYTFVVTGTNSGAGCQGPGPISNTTITLVVNSATVNTTTSVANATATYGDASVTLNATVTPASGPAVNNGSVTFTVKQGATTIGVATTDNTVVAGAASVSYALPAGTNAGAYTIEAAYTPGAGFNGSNGTGSLTINKASSSTTINCPTNVTYTGSPQTPCTATATGAGGLNVSVTVVYGNNTNAGTATADATYGGDANHNSSVATQVTFTIDKASSSTTINCPTNVTYDGSPQTPCSATATGAGGLNVSVTVVYGNNTNAGTATADATYAGDANHNGSTATQVTFTIDKRTLTAAIVGNPTKVYDANPTATLTSANFSISNLAPGQSLTVTKTVGTYNSKDVPTANNVSTTLVSGDFSAGPGTNLNNYNLPTSAAGAGHITAKSLAITADDKSFLFGSPLATFTASFNAFASGESVANLSGTLTFTIKNSLNVAVPYNGSTPASTYTIVPSGVTSTNYNISFVNGTLTIGAWTLTGFYQPVDMSTTAIVWNSIKGGSTVPLKFNIFANGVEKKALTDVQGFSVAEIPCSSAGFIADIEFTTTGGTSLRYDGTGGQFIQNWQTPKAPGKCYQTRMTALDGSHIDAYFKSK